MTATLWSALALGLAVGAPGPKEARKDPPSLVGEWAVETMVVEGTPKHLPAGSAWTFTPDGTAVLRVGRKGARDEGTFTANAAKDPAEVDIVLDPRTTQRGIYRVEGDKLTLCLSHGGDRPAAFDAPAGSHASLWTLKRVAKKE